VEDIGRHNTLDRIAGEAMMRGIELAGMMLVTSGRISAEMAAKAAHLGIALLASRTSATDMAKDMCRGRDHPCRLRQRQQVHCLLSCGWFILPTGQKGEFGGQLPNQTDSQIGMVPPNSAHRSRAGPRSAPRIAFSLFPVYLPEQNFEISPTSNVISSLGTS
jgi:hypothetical protein